MTVTWPLASFALLAVALAAGFAWYERAHPSSQVLALVATLAALAALGRVAFAPLPERQADDRHRAARRLRRSAARRASPSARSPRSRRTSFFGQGPWTPWQMVAWGAGRPLRRRARRAPAGGAWGACRSRVACGLAGLLFGAIMDFCTWVTFSGTHTLGGVPRLLGDVGLPFNLAHAVGQRRLLPRLRARARPRAAALPRALRRSAGSPVARRRRCAIAARSRLGDRRARAAPARPSRVVATSLRAQNGDGGLRRRAAASARPALHGLGRRSGLAARGATAARAARAATCSAAAASQRATPATSSGRSSRSWPARVAPARGRRRPRASPRPCASAATARRRAWSTRRASRSSRCAPPGAGSAQARRGGALARPPAERRRRLQLRRPRRAERDRRHRGRRSQALVAASAARHARAPRGALPRCATRTATAASPLEPGGAVERPVDGLGGPGARRRRAATRRACSAAARAARSGYLRTLIAGDGAVRYSRTSRADAGLGHGAGADRARPPPVPAPVTNRCIGPRRAHLIG